jgi:hypothetical protein
MAQNCCRLLPIWGLFQGSFAFCFLVSLIASCSFTDLLSFVVGFDSPTSADVYIC